MAAGMTRGAISKQMRELAAQHGFEWTSTTQGYAHYVSVEDSVATLLALVWRPANSFQRFYIVDCIPDQKQP